MILMHYAPTNNIIIIVVLLILVYKISQIVTILQWSNKRYYNTIKNISLIRNKY